MHVNLSRNWRNVGYTVRGTTPLPTPTGPVVQMVKICLQCGITGSGRSLGEGNGYPLQYSCLDNPMDKGAWQATVHGVTRGGHDREPSIAAVLRLLIRVAAVSCLVFLQQCSSFSYLFFTQDQQRNRTEIAEFSPDLTEESQVLLWPWPRRFACWPHFLLFSHSVTFDSL